MCSCVLEYVAGGGAKLLSVGQVFALEPLHGIAISASRFHDLDLLKEPGKTKNI